MQPAADSRGDCGSLVPSGWKMRVINSCDKKMALYRPECADDFDDDDNDIEMEVEYT